MIEAKNINFYYGDFHALKNISIAIKPNTVTAFIDHPVVANLHFCACLIE